MCVETYARTGLGNSNDFCDLEFLFSLVAGRSQRPIATSPAHQSDTNYDCCLPYCHVSSARQTTEPVLKYRFTQTYARSVSHSNASSGTHCKCAWACAGQKRSSVRAWTHLRAHTDKYQRTHAHTSTQVHTHTRKHTHTHTHTHTRARPAQTHSHRHSRMRVPRNLRIFTSTLLPDILRH